jgi:hypothetical protein
VNVPDRVRLPLTFDVPALAAEVAALDPGLWVPHFNRDVYEGDWVGVALRSVGGAAGQLYPDPAAAAPFADTEILDRCPAHRRALAQFGCPVMAARLLALAPGAVLKEHSDLNLGWEDGEIRLHVPIITADQVEFVLDGSPVDLPAGQCWYLNLNRTHSAVNRSDVTRVHLVVDCVVDRWLSETMTRALSDKTSMVRPNDEEFMTKARIGREEGVR